MARWFESPAPALAAGNCVLVKPADVATYVEYGAADAGIAGLDVVLESRADLVQPLALNFGRCKLAVAAPAGVELSPSENPNDAS